MRIATYALAGYRLILFITAIYLVPELLSITTTPLLKTNPGSLPVPLHRHGVTLFARGYCSR